MDVTLRNMAGNEYHITINENEELISVIKAYIRMVVVQPLYFNKFVEALKDLFEEEPDSANVIFGVKYNNNTYFYTDTLFWRMQQYVVENIQIIDLGESVYNYVLMDPSHINDNGTVYTEFVNKMRQIWHRDCIEVDPDENQIILCNNIIIPYVFDWSDDEQ